jgi:hypothetical protein
MDFLMGRGEKKEIVEMVDFNPCIWGEFDLETSATDEEK